MNVQHGTLRLSGPASQRRCSDAEYRGWYVEIVGPADVIREVGYLWIISFCGIVAVGDAPSFDSGTAAAIAAIDRVASHAPWN